MDYTLYLLVDMEHDLKPLSPSTIVTNIRNVRGVKDAEMRSNSGLVEITVDGNRDKAGIIADLEGMSGIKAGSVTDKEG